MTEQYPCQYGIKARLSGEKHERRCRLMNTRIYDITTCKNCEHRTNEINYIEDIIGVCSSNEKCNTCLLEKICSKILDRKKGAKT